MKKRVLIISPVPTHQPFSGNRIRIKTLVETLVFLGAEVHFFYVNQEPADIPAMRQAWKNRFHYTNFNFPSRSFFTRVKWKIISIYDQNSKFQYGIDEWWDKGVESQILDLHKSVNFDVVVVEYVFFSKALDLFDSKTTKIIDTHDVFSNRYQTYFANGLQPQWYSTYPSQESKALERADIVIAIQNEEKELLCRLTKTKIVTIGHIVPLSQPKVKDCKNNILFVGSQNPLNEISIKWFIDVVFPVIKKDLPSAHLTIAGSVCNSLEASPSVAKLGAVNDLESVFDSADMVINPLRYGTGLKIKSIEALGYAKPLVTCPAGAAGLDDCSGSVFIIADNEIEFAQASINILTSSSQRTQLANSAYRYATQWNKSIKMKISKTILGSYEI